MKRLLIASIFLVFVWNNGFSLNDVRLLRFPAIHSNQVVFSYAGDLYTVSAEGGTARRLTSDEKGYEIFPRFSPDGSQIAFTAQYDGNTEVFIIPALGGIPQRLTYTATLGRDDISDRMGPNNIVITWADNNHIIYRSRKQSFNSFIGQLFKVSTDGGLSKELPLPTGSWCSFSPDGKKMAMNRVFREFRTWKYYKGGMADDVWIFDFETGETTNITNNDNQNIFPMWKDDKIYFLSDRDRTMNLFAYDINSKQTTKLTDYTEYDIKFPSLGDKSIIYENGGYLYNYELGSGTINKITVNIDNDLNTARSGFVDASKYLDDLAISPDGKRVVASARGDVFTIPEKSGITRNLTESSGVHERNVAWSPDGKYISYLSDRTGEDEIYAQIQDGSLPATQITSNSDTYKYQPIWSPDSKKLLWSDKKDRLNMVDVTTKKITVIDTCKDWEIRTYSWSPDSRWIAYTLPSIHSVSNIYIFDTQSGSSYRVSDSWYNADEPVFDTEGKYLFFISSRDFHPLYSWVEFNYAYQDMDGIYFVPLLKSTASPLKPENDEVNMNNTQPQNDQSPEKNKKDKKSTDDKAIPVVNIDFDGIAERVEKLPIQAGSYEGLFVSGNNVYYTFSSASVKTEIMKFFDLKEKKETDLGTAKFIDISANYKKILISIDNKYAVIDLPKSTIKPEKFLDLSNMMVKVDFAAEWKQIYTESWRQMRDFFYAPNMHGLDWPKIKDKYAVLLPYVKNRNDLNYIIGEMIGELSVGHAYISGGDKPAPERIKTGLLGAKIAKDPSGYFIVNKILIGENWEPATRSPLTDPGVNVKEGDFIIAIDGKTTKNTPDIYEMLLGKADKEILLTVNSTATADGAHDVLVKPVGDESGLYYLNWVRGNIEKVNKATNGQVGYIHIPDMSSEGLNEFVKYFYPQLDKKALIIDDRGNGGGNVSPLIIERLNRELTLFGMSRNNGVTTKPGQMMLGPKVLLIDNYSASDGDLFPYQFKKLKIGKVIGVRSWGGVVGIRGSLPFIDGGQLRKPEFAPFNEQGKWVIEGHGVDPDIVIDNDPSKEYAGVDQQLNKAIEVILEQLKDFKTPPDIPPFPDKSK